jgi:hypothetical protein
VPVPQATFPEKVAVRALDRLPDSALNVTNALGLGRDFLQERTFNPKGLFGEDRVTRFTGDAGERGEDKLNRVAQRLLNIGTVRTFTGEESQKETVELGRVLQRFKVQKNFPSVPDDIEKIQPPIDGKTRELVQAFRGQYRKVIMRKLVESKEFQDFKDSEDIDVKVVIKDAIEGELDRADRESSAMIKEHLLSQFQRGERVTMDNFGEAEGINFDALGFNLKERFSKDQGFLGPLGELRSLVNLTRDRR